MNCNHDNVYFYVDASAHEDTNVRVIRVSASCKHCNQSFRFLGMDRERLPALMHPRVQNGGNIACLPMVADNETPRLAAN